MIVMANPTNPTTPTNPSTTPTPTTCVDIMELASTLSFEDAQSVLGQIPDSIKMPCFLARWSNFGYGFMHSVDHQTALEITLGRKPTWLEVQDSCHQGGDTAITEARRRTGRPGDWEHYNLDQKKLSVLTYLYGTSRGSKILDGTLKDPDPIQTDKMMLLWTGSINMPTPVSPTIPITPTTPTTPTSPPHSNVEDQTLKMIREKAKTLRANLPKTGGAPMQKVIKTVKEFLDVVE